MKTINFNAGPSQLPQVVLEQAAASILNFENTGTSILSLPHRSKAFVKILEEAKAITLSLLDLSSEDYDVCWMQGGGRSQFAWIPMNFLPPGKKAGYLISGHWAKDAYKHALYYGEATIVGTSESESFVDIPTIQEGGDTAALSYIHMTSNNTIYGTQFKTFPKVECPLIVDMSSEILSRDIDYSQFDMMYAVAQKNIGPSGVTLVVMKKSFLATASSNIPEIFSYKAMMAKNSLVNTAPVFSIYCSLLNLRWIQQQGLQHLDALNSQKATLLYDFIDNSALFYGTVNKSARSTMNVCFRMQDESLMESLLAFTELKGILNIKGHRSVGGCRVSLYNAISLADVQYLVDCLKEFETTNISK